MRLTGETGKALKNNIQYMSRRLRRRNWMARRNGDGARVQRAVAFGNGHG